MYFISAPSIRLGSTRMDDNMRNVRHARSPRQAGAPRARVAGARLGPSRLLSSLATGVLKPLAGMALLFTGAQIAALIVLPVTALPAGATAVPAAGEHAASNRSSLPAANPFCSHISLNRVSGIVGQKMVLASASQSRGLYGALCVYGSHVAGTPGRSMVQLEVGQVAKDFFASLGRVEEDLKGMLRDPEFAADRSLGPGGVAFRGKMQLETVAGITAFRGHMEFTVLESNRFAALAASKEAQLLELAEEAGVAVPAERPNVPVFPR